ncbi:MAG: SHOCT domain-containing protein, partial [Candidatus Lokiarchaeota archaeon]
MKFAIQELKTNSESRSTKSFSVADELLKFKTLQDSGVITNEEFERKK